MNSYEETLSTLKFADRAHSLMNKIQPNIIGIKNNNIKESQLIHHLQKEIFNLNAVLNLRKRNFPTEVKLRNEINELKNENSYLKKELSKYKLINSYKNIKYKLEENNELENKINNEHNFVNSYSQNDIFKKRKKNSTILPKIKLNTNKSFNNISLFKHNFKFISKNLKFLDQMRICNNNRMKKEIEELINNSKKKNRKSKGTIHI